MQFSRGHTFGGVLRAGAWAAVIVLVGTAALASESGSRNPARLVGLSGRGTASEPAPAGSSAPSTAAFTISGKAGGLYPGAVRSLKLTVTNHESFAIVVTSLTTTPGAARAGCGASNLTVTSFSGRLRVPARGKASTSVHAKMAHSAPNACQGAVFPLRYTGKATKAA